MGNVYSVSQVNGYIKRLFWQDPHLGRISVKGEVSNCTYANSGHIYFTLKDEGGILSAVMYARQRRGLSFDMKRGDQVIVHGRMDVYEKNGVYQLIAERIEEAGQGALYQRFLQLKAKLEGQGLFDPAHKKPLPRFIQRIGIATAATGAAIRDIESISKRRNPYVKLFLAPCLVQGAEAPASLIRALGQLDQMGLDVIIIGRGGGSIEDLFAFNDEALARTIFEAKTPIVSAVGHETDFTIADFVADLRAPTPSGAAEICNFLYEEFEAGIRRRQRQLQDRMEQRLDYIKRDLDTCLFRLNAHSPSQRAAQQRKRAEHLEELLLLHIKKKLEGLRGRLKVNALRLSAHSPQEKIKGQKDRAAAHSLALKRAMDNCLIQARRSLELYLARLKGCSPLERLSGGYAYVQNLNYQRITSSRDLHLGEEIYLHFHDGRVRAKVEESGEENGKYQE